MHLRQVASAGRSSRREAAQAPAKNHSSNEEATEAPSEHGHDFAYLSIYAAATRIVAADVTLDMQTSRDATDDTLLAG